jgi:hypothetical protein
MAYSRESQNRTEVLWSNRPLGIQPGLFDLHGPTTGSHPSNGDTA